MPNNKIQRQLLVVEDDSLMAAHVQLQLLCLGYPEPEIVDSGEAALVAINARRPSLVLMDIELGAGIDGITTAREILEKYDVPVIFLTVHAEDTVLERAKLARPFGFLLKPFTERELHATLEMALYKYETEKKLHDLAEHNQVVLDNMFDGVITIQSDGIIDSFNQAASKIFGYSAAEVLGKNISILMPEPHKSHHDGYLQHFRQTGEARVIGHQRDLEGQRKDGSIFPITLAVTKVVRAGQKIFIGLVRDITQRREDENEIRRLAFFDDLTGLPNRRLLLDRLRHAMLTATRNGQHGAVILLDLDHFKHINDTQGHHIGDQLLRECAMRLQHCVREGDTVARLGGDEFVILLENLSHQEHEAGLQAEAVGMKVIRALSETFNLSDFQHTSTASLGLVIFMQDHESIEELLKKADVAMYQAKASGRNTIRFFDPKMQAAANDYLALKYAMQVGLKDKQFVLYYQIQVALDNTITGVEALIRWHHPQRGLISPAQFIPLAEESGLILELGQWVLEEACRQLVRWARHPVCSSWNIAVNVSTSQFIHSDFVANVLHALAITGANPQRLKLEITESMLINDIDSVIDKMAAIKLRGVSFSLDDFGTGYSSLSYLKRLPLDQLKIDQSFVRDLLHDASDAMIVRTILALGHNLQLQVIAEGVETCEQRNLLAEMGCDVFQGYYFGKPVAVGNLSPLIYSLENSTYAHLA